MALLPEAAAAATQLPLSSKAKNPSASQPSPPLYISKCQQTASAPFRAVYIDQLRVFKIGDDEACIQSFIKIREKMKIVEGTKFAVYGSGDTIIFKKMELPSVKESEKIVDFGVKFAKKKGITEKDVLEGD